MIKVQENDGARRGHTKVYVKDPEKIKKFVMLKNKVPFSRMKIKHHE